MNFFGRFVLGLENQLLPKLADLIPVSLAMVEKIQIFHLPLV
jgi:hypothetical protein